MAENRYKRAEKVFPISLGCRGWVFKSPHSDQNPSEIIDFRGIFLILCLLRHRRRACHSQHIFSTGADLIL